MEREELIEQLQKRLTNEIENTDSNYEAFTKTEIVDSYASNTTLSDAQLKSLLGYDGNLLEYLYSIFAKGEDEFARVIEEKLDYELSEVRPVKSF